MIRRLDQYDGTMLSVSDLKRSPVLRIICAAGDVLTLLLYVEAHMMSLYGPHREFGVVPVLTGDGKERIQ